MRFQRHVLAVAVALALLAILRLSPDELAPDAPAPGGSGAGQPAARTATAGGADPAPASLAAPAALPPAEEAGSRGSDSAPPTHDPEALSEWFEARVLQGLAADADPDAAREAAGLRASLGRDDWGVDWQYVRDVFAGRISGIPDERKAGISLQELDRIGDVPYLEQLRQEKRFDELQELGFENENAPWPSCLRSATCRRDRSSSPPS